jgi:hypothetical protein
MRYDQTNSSESTKNLFIIMVLTRVFRDVDFDSNREIVENRDREPRNPRKLKFLDRENREIENREIEKNSPSISCSTTNIRVYVKIRLIAYYYIQIDYMYLRIQHIYYI